MSSFWVVTFEGGSVDVIDAGSAEEGHARAPSECGEIKRIRPYSDNEAELDWLTYVHDTVCARDGISTEGFAFLFKERLAAEQDTPNTRRTMNPEDARKMLELLAEIRDTLKRIAGPTPEEIAAEAQRQAEAREQRRLEALASDRPRVRTGAWTTSGVVPDRGGSGA